MHLNTFDNAAVRWRVVRDAGIELGKLEFILGEEPVWSGLEPGIVVRGPPFDHWALRPLPAQEWGHVDFDDR